MKDFLPVTIEDMKKRGWERPDFVFVIGDAYVDHSSFGPAIISRVLESKGYKVAIISQPDWKNEESIGVFGEPKLGFLVCSGNMDSMVNKYTVNKKPRSSDAYSPGGKAGYRPDDAVKVYCNLIKKKYKKTPIIIGGIEASLRRLAHYDYWSDRLRRSILLDSGADILMYGMGELSIVEIADALSSGLDITDITFVPGTVYKSRTIEHVYNVLELPDYDLLTSDKLNYAKSFYIQYCNTDFSTGRPLSEKYGENRYVVQNPPQRPLTTREMDDIYELPFMNNYHPSYEKDGGVPAITESRFSLTSSRGCFGGCSFCALTFHQGRIVQARSHESLVKEACEMTKYPDFKGYINDVGGPTANFRVPACDKQLKHGACKNKQCLYPSPCSNLKVSHKDYMELLKKLREINGVKKVFVRSGIRFDYLLADKDDSFLYELCRHHVSGQLRVAPEHVTPHVLALMGKPKAEVYDRFCKKFETVNKKLKKDQYILPYLMSSHPGSTLNDAIALAEKIRDMGYMPEQVQDFYPTPSTISTVMYYTGVDPRNMKPIPVASDPHEKAMQRALLQYRDPKNYKLVKEALLKAHREDLIGFDKKCLIPPREMGHYKKAAGNMSESSKNPGPKPGKSRNKRSNTGKVRDNIKTKTGKKPLQGSSKWKK